jgi:predicted Zn-dependent protease with MMP-like domain
VLATLPVEKRTQLKAVRFEVTDLPLIEDLTSVDPPFPPSILGLFRNDPAQASPSIVLYRKNLARVAHTRMELSEQIRDTVLHEIGHFDGLDEDDLRRRRME